MIEFLLIIGGMIFLGLVITILFLMKAKEIKEQNDKIYKKHGSK